MAQLQAILSYQEADSKLFKLERELASSNERKEYVKLKKYLETATEKLDALELKATALKTDAEELAKQYLQTEDALKDFDFEHLGEMVADGGANIAFYKKKAQEMLDRLKKLKTDVNALTSSIKATDEEYKKLKKQVIAVQKEQPEIFDKYKAAKAATEPQRKAIEGELKTLEKDVPPEMLEVYKTKRKEKIFPVVGKVTADKRCPFCSMQPSLAEQNKLSSGETVECFTCRRILFSE